MKTFVTKSKKPNGLTVIILYASAIVFARALTVTVDALLSSIGIVSAAFGGSMTKAFAISAVLALSGTAIRGPDVPPGTVRREISGRDLGAAAVAVLISACASGKSGIYPSTAAQLICELTVFAVLRPIAMEAFFHGRLFSGSAKGFYILPAAACGALLCPGYGLFNFAAMLLTGMLRFCGMPLYGAAIINVFMSSSLVLLKNSLNTGACAAANAVVAMLLICITYGAADGAADYLCGRKYNNEPT